MCVWGERERGTKEECVDEIWGNAWELIVNFISLE